MYKEGEKNLRYLEVPRGTGTSRFFVCLLLLLLFYIRT